MWFNCWLVYRPADNLLVDLKGGYLTITKLKMILSQRRTTASHAHRDVLKSRADTLEGIFLTDTQASCSESVVNRRKQTYPTGHVALPICLSFDLPTLSAPASSAGCKRRKLR